jgi:hypothetical protein
LVQKTLIQKLGDPAENPKCLGQGIQCGKHCNVCEAFSFHVYSKGWMCLNTACLLFWKVGLFWLVFKGQLMIFLELADGTKPSSGTLTYEPNFIQQTIPFSPELLPPYNILPNTLTSARDLQCNITDLPLCGSFFCENCGRLSCR